jgi:hypothetical protein
MTVSPSGLPARTRPDRSRPNKVASMTEVSKIYNGVPVCSRQYATCACPYAHPKLAAALARLLPPTWPLPGRVTSWVLGYPCWLGPHETEVPAHFRGRLQLDLGERS